MPGLDEERMIAVGFEAWNSRTVEAFVRDHVHADVLLVDIPDLPDAGEHRGKEAYLRRVREWSEPLGPFHVEVTELLDGPNAIMAAIEATGQGTGSGVPMEFNLFNVFRFRDGLLSEFRVFRDRDAALAEAGIDDR